MFPWKYLAILIIIIIIIITIIILLWSSSSLDTRHTVEGRDNGNIRHSISHWEENLYVEKKKNESNYFINENQQQICTEKKNYSTQESVIKRWKEEKI